MRNTRENPKVRGECAPRQSRYSLQPVDNVHGEKGMRRKEWKRETTTPLSQPLNTPFAPLASSLKGLGLSVTCTDNKRGGVGEEVKLSLGKCKEKLLF